MTSVPRDNVGECELTARRPGIGLRERVFRPALLLAACSLTLSLWVPGFHHHAARSHDADCAVCLTVAAQSWDLPIAAATLPVPPPAEARSLIERTPPNVADALDDSEAPRGPPLT